MKEEALALDQDVIEMTITDAKNIRHDAVPGAGSYEIGYNIGCYVVLGVRIEVIVAEEGLYITVLRKHAADERVMKNEY